MSRPRPQWDYSVPQSYPTRPSGQVQPPANVSITQPTSSDSTGQSNDLGNHLVPQSVGVRSSNSMPPPSGNVGPFSQPTSSASIGQSSGMNHSRPQGNPVQQSYPGQMPPPSGNAGALRQPTSSASPSQPNNAGYLLPQSFEPGSSSQITVPPRNVAFRQLTPSERTNQSDSMDYSVTQSRPAQSYSQVAAASLNVGSGVRSSGQMPPIPAWVWEGRGYEPDENWNDYDLFNELTYAAQSLRGLPSLWGLPMLQAPFADRERLRIHGSLAGHPFSQGPAPYTSPQSRPQMPTARNVGFRQSTVSERTIQSDSMDYSVTQSRPAQPSAQVPAAFDNVRRSTSSVPTGQSSNEGYFVRQNLAPLNSSQTPTLSNNVPSSISTLPPSQVNSARSFIAPRPFQSFWSGSTSQRLNLRRPQAQSSSQAGNEYRIQVTPSEAEFFPFSKLEREVRNMIYRHLVVSPSKMHLGSEQTQSQRYAGQPPTKPSKLSRASKFRAKIAKKKAAEQEASSQPAPVSAKRLEMAIAGTCQLIYQEAYEIFFHDNEFSIILGECPGLPTNSAYPAISDSSLRLLYSHAIEHIEKIEIRIPVQDAHIPEDNYQEGDTKYFMTAAVRKFARGNRLKELSIRLCDVATDNHFQIKEFTIRVLQPLKQLRKVKIGGISWEHTFPGDFELDDGWASSFREAARGNAPIVLD